MTEQLSIAGLPGAEIVERGLADLESGTDSADANALRLASGRLRAVGIPIDPSPPGEPAAHRLYAILAAEHGDGAHSRYNATLARIASFCRAAEARAGGR